MAHSGDVPRLKAALFHEMTTYSADYTLQPMDDTPKTVYDEKPRKPRKPYEILKDLHTMTPYLHKIPFSLGHRPKNVVRTNPHDLQKEYDLHPVDPLKDEIRRTRPRMAMFPAVEVDDFTPENREIALDSVYKSTYRRAYYREDKPAFLPMVKVPAPASPLKLQPYRPLNVEPEWRWDSVQWDAKMLRTTPTMEYRFWKEADIYKDCRACKETIQNKIAKRQKKI